MKRNNIKKHTKNKFKLFITGQTSKSEKIIKKLKKLLDDEFKNQYSLEIIDVIENPELAKKERIFATPTLIKSFPLPIKRVIGDLDNKKNILLGLNLRNPNE